MSLRRDDDTYDEQLRREAGLGDPRETRVGDTEERVDTLEEEHTFTVDAPGIAGDRFTFAVVPDGTMLVEEEDAETGLGQLADAIEERVAPPYRAFAERESGDRWTVAAGAISVVELPGLDADEVRLVVKDGVRVLIVDDEPSGERIQELEHLGDETYESYYLRADRLDEAWWEVDLDPL